jgi:hypothetical protein
MGMGILKKHKWTPCHPHEREKEPCVEEDCQSQSLDYNRGLGFVKRPSNNEDHEACGRCGR